MAIFYSITLHINQSKVSPLDRLGINIDLLFAKLNCIKFCEVSRRMLFEEQYACR
jgi:hypothetical protein